MNHSLNIIMNKQARKSVMSISIFLLIVGLLGIILPQFMAMAVTLFIGWLFILAGLFTFYITWHGFRDRWVVWLKPFIFFAVGLLILFHPLAGSAALGLMIAVYFLFDGFAGLVFAWELKPYPGWLWLLFNGLLSLLLATVFIIGWPFTSAWLVGLLIGISLFLDGLTLLMLAMSAEVA